MFYIMPPTLVICFKQHNAEKMGYEMLTLYHDGASYNSQKVRLFLVEKNIPWESIHFDLLRQEHLTEDYFQINPQGLVPALSDNGNIILNSTDIMKYLDENYVKDNLNNKIFSNEIYVFSKKNEGLHDPYIRTLSFHHLWMSKKRPPEERNRILNIAHRHPNKARGRFLKRAIQSSFSDSEINLAKSKIVYRLNEIEYLLKSSGASYIFGNNYSMANTVVTAFLCRISRLNFSENINQAPLLSNYFTNMKNRSSFVRAKVF